MLNREAWRRALENNIGRRAQVITVFDDPNRPQLSTRPDPNLYPVLKEFDDECVVLEYEGTVSGLVSVVRREQVVAIHLYDPEKWDER